MIIERDERGGATAASGSKPEQPIRAPHSQKLKDCSNRIAALLTDADKVLATENCSSEQLEDIRNQLDVWIERGKSREAYVLNPKGIPSEDGNDLKDWQGFYRSILPNYAKLQARIAVLQKQKDEVGSVTSHMSKLTSISRASSLSRFATPKERMNRLKKDVVLAKRAQVAYDKHISQEVIDDIALPRVSKHLQILEMRDQQLKDLSWPDDLEEESTDIEASISDLVMQFRKIVRDSNMYDNLFDIQDGSRKPVTSVPQVTQQSTVQSTTDAVNTTTTTSQPVFQTVHASVAGTSIVSEQQPISLVNQSAVSSFNPVSLGQVNTSQTMFGSQQEASSMEINQPLISLGNPASYPTVNMPVFSYSSANVQSSLPHTVYSMGPAISSQQGLGQSQASFYPVQPVSSYLQTPIQPVLSVNPVVSQQSQVPGFSQSYFSSAHATAPPVLNPHAIPYTSAADSMVRMQLENAPIEKFRGKYSHYLDWRAQACANLFNPHFPPESRYSKLMKHLEGAPKELVADLPYNNGNNILDAFTKLDAEYADRRKILLSQVKILEQLPQFNSFVDSEGQKFIRLVESVAVSIAAMGNNAAGDNELMMMECLKKTPDHIRGRWIRKTEGQRNLPTFGELIEFLKFTLKTDSYSSSLREQNKKEGERNHQSFHRHRKQNDPNVAGSSLESNPKKRPMPCVNCNDPSHPIWKCEKFLKMSDGARLARVRELKLCFRCLSPHLRKDCKARSGCIVDKKCKYNHHSLLHFDKSKSKQQGSESSDEVMGAAVSESVESRTLRVIKVNVRAGEGKKERTVVALLDLGCNRTKLLESEARKLGIPLEIKRVKQYGLGHQATVPVAPLKFEIRGIDCDQWYTVNHATSSRNFGLPDFVLPTDEWPLSDKLIGHFKGISYRDIKMVIGIDQERLFLPQPDSMINLQENGLLAYRTKLGWTVSADTIVQVNTLAAEFSFLIFDDEAEKQRNDNLSELTSSFRKFCDTETFGVNCKTDVVLSRMEQDCLNQMEKSVRFENGHFHVSPLWKKNVSVPDNSELTARSRLKGLMYRLSKNQKLAEQYKKRFEDDVQKGYISILSEQQSEELRKGEHFFLPHFPVFHPDKPEKVRRVFDAAAKTSGISLNDMLLKGPNNITSLIGILVRFRVGKIAVNADIIEMFPQVRVHPEDEKRLAFIWKDPFSKEEKTCLIKYHLFGAASSPAVAIFAVQMAAKKFEKKYPGLTELVKLSFYMDDYYAGFNTVNDAIIASTQTDEALGACSFQLSQWCSNSLEFINFWPQEKQTPSIKNVGDKDSPLRIKALGIQWNCTNDMLFFSSRKIKQEPVTLADLLSILASIYDPLGLIGPYTFKGKAILSKLWKKHKSWKAVLDVKDQEEWREFIDGATQVGDLATPRWYGTQIGQEVVLNTFSDASETGFGAVTYVTTDKQSMLVAAKSRVTPAKGLTIPRAELQGSIMSVRLTETIQEELKNHLKIKKLVLWIDSTSVLGWIKNEAKRYVVFVANRIGEIQDAIEKWEAQGVKVEVQYVRSKLNPADYLTRGFTGEEFASVHDMWIHGPDFLLDESKRPAQPQNHELKSDEDLRTKETEVICAAIEDTGFPWSKYQKCEDLNVFLIDQLQGQAVTKTLLLDTENQIIRTVQKEAFQKEITGAQENKGRIILHSGPLKKLEVFLDSDGILRVISRLEETGEDIVPWEIQNPIALPNKHQFTDLVIRDAHRVVGHLKYKSTRAEVRRRFIIPKFESKVRSVVYKCEHCTRLTPKPVNVPLAPLHKNRVVAVNQPVFTSTGMDFFGPYVIAAGSKVYGLILTCMTTRAVHLEACKRIDTESCLAAIDRFVSRRTKPDHIQCDLGSNFVGADNDMKKSLKLLSEVMPKEAIEKQRIEIEFNAAGSPNQGGAWERLIKDVKRCIRASTETVSKFSFEAFTTLLVRVEKIMNNRPLAFDDEGIPMAPNLFLNPTKAVVGSLPFECSAIKMLRKVQQAETKFWLDWKKLYLYNISADRLQRRGKFVQLKVGDMVLIDESKNAEFVNSWSPAKIVKVYPSSDGVVRAADVQITASDEIVHRGLSRIYINESSHYDIPFWNSAPIKDH